MKMKNYISIAIIIVLVIGGYFVYRTIIKTTTPEVQPEQQSQPVEPIEETVSGFERITLSSHNWEAIGSTIIIKKDGAYIVESGRPGIKDTSEGKLTSNELDELSKVVDSTNVFSLSDKYTGQWKTTRSWTQFNLIIETKTGSKSVSFHSEDETAPQILHNLVNKIIEITK